MSMFVVATPFWHRDPLIFRIFSWLIANIQLLNYDSGVIVIINRVFVFLGMMCFQL